MDYELTEHASKRMQERKIQEQWLETTMANPDMIVLDAVDPDARHALKKIADMEDRVLRVVYNDVTSPKRFISVYIDRGMRGKL